MSKIVTYSWLKTVFLHYYYFSFLKLDANLIVWVVEAQVTVLAQEEAVVVDLSRRLCGHVVGLVHEFIRSGALSSGKRHRSFSIAASIQFHFNFDKTWLGVSQLKCRSKLNKKNSRNSQGRGSRMPPCK
jgi:hypothetical protein